MTCGQVPLVKVLKTVMVTLVPQQTSEAVGSSKVQAEPHSTGLGAAQVMTGAVVSAPVTIWLQVALLVEQSVACQVRVMTCGQVPLVVVLEIVTVTLVPQQASEAVGSSKVQAEPH